MKKRQISFAGLHIILLFFLPFTVYGVQPDSTVIVLKGNDTQHSVIGKLRLLEDKTNTLLFKDVVRQSVDFKKVTQEVVNLGPSGSIIWLQFKVENKTSKDLFLHIDAPYLKEVTLYKQQNQGNFSQITAGSGKPFDARPVLVTDLILPLNLNQGDNSNYYLRVKSNSVLRVPLEIATMQYIFETEQVGDIANGLYFGLIAALIIYNLFVFISLRERTYLFYVFYIISIAMNISYTKGYFLQFVLPDFPVLNHSNYSGAFAFSFAVLFTNSFLNTPLYCPGMKKMGYAIFASAAFSFCISLFGELLIGFYISWLLCGIFIYYMIRTGFIVYRKGFIPAKYYLMGFCSLFAGIIIYMLKDNALIPDNWLSESSYQLGSALEAIILSFALANKLNVFKREKEYSQNQALEQANLFSRQLIGSQENERKRVAAELHDSLGQSLGLVKNKVLLLKRDSEKPLVRNKQISDLEIMVTETIQEVRTISYNLRPLHLELLGITQSIHSLLEDIAESGLINIQTEIQTLDDLLPKSSEINVFRIVQECFNNIVKHSRATEAIIKINTDKSSIKISIEDNGIGMQPSESGRTGFGLIGIKERLNILNGTMQILENTPHGTIIDITIPL